MELKCPTCEYEGVVQILRGYEGNPVLMYKCTQCGREFFAAEECTDGCKIGEK